jgi:hypothetical protein
VGTATHPLRSTERKNHPCPRHRPDALRHDLSISERHVETRARVIEQRYRHGRRTDRKTSARPSIYRNCCGGQDTRIRDQEIGVRCLRHWIRLQRNGGLKLVGCCDGGVGGRCIGGGLRIRHVGRLRTVASARLIHHRHRQSV